MPKILLVCTANICRSPMAMVLLEKMLHAEPGEHDWQVESAGTWGRDGSRASEHGQTIMSRWEMDLSEHRSRVVTSQILEAADLILVMENGHKEALRVEFPQVASRVFLLSEMAGIAYDVADPYGGPFEEYLETAGELRGLLETGLPRIKQLALDQAGSSRA